MAMSKARSPHEANGRNAGIGGAKKLPAIRFAPCRATEIQAVLRKVAGSL